MRAPRSRSKPPSLRKSRLSKFKSQARQIGILMAHGSHDFFQEARMVAKITWRRSLVEIEANLSDLREAFYTVRRRWRRMVQGKLNPRPEREDPAMIGETNTGNPMPVLPQAGAGISLAKHLAGGSEAAKLPGIRPIQNKETTHRLKNVLIVGGMDFFGAALVHQMNAAGFREITITDQLAEESCRRIAPLQFREFLSQEEYEDISKSRFRPFSEYSHIFYLREWTSQNFGQAKALFEATNKGGARFIAVSPASSLGPQQPCSIEERHNPNFFRPLTCDGLVAGLFDRHIFSKGASKNHLSLKHHLLFGPGEPENGGLEGFIKSCHRQFQSKGRIHLPTALQSGSQESCRRFDFLCVQDAARLALFLAQSHQAEGVYEVGSGISVTAGEFVDTTLSALGAPNNTVWDDHLEYHPPSQQPEKAWLGRLRETGWKETSFDLHAAVTHYINTFLGPGIDLGDEPGRSGQAPEKTLTESQSLIPQKKKPKNSSSH